MGSGELLKRVEAEAKYGRTPTVHYEVQPYTEADVRRLAMEYLAEIEERCESMKYDPPDTITLAPFADLLKEKNYG